MRGSAKRDGKGIVMMMECLRLCVVCVCVCVCAQFFYRRFQHDKHIFGSCT